MQKGIRQNRSDNFCLISSRLRYCFHFVAYCVFKLGIKSYRNNLRTPIPFQSMPISAFLTLCLNIHNSDEGRGISFYLFKSDLKEFVVFIPKSFIASVECSLCCCLCLCYYASSCTGNSPRTCTTTVSGATSRHPCAGPSGEFSKRSNHCGNRISVCIIEQLNYYCCCIICEVWRLRG